MMRLIVHAANIHQGGGKTLLDAIIGVLQANQNIILIVDSRMVLPLNLAQNVQVKKVFPTIIKRLLTEWWLYRNVQHNDVVLCLGNLPPLLKLIGRVKVFVQNRYLIDNIELNKLPLKVRLRLFVERLWLSSRRNNVDEFIVQTPTMQKLMLHKTKELTPVRILPFVADNAGDYQVEISQSINKESDFVYVASGEPHKNHKNLIDAWCLLAKDGLFPKLVLTIDSLTFPDLVEWIEKKTKDYQLRVYNLESLSHSEVMQLYINTKALIYPSVFESLGLPLIEAKQMKLPILASESDYVRDILNPEQTFDPNSSISISRAVMRFLGKDNEKIILLDPQAFLEQIQG